MKNKLKPGQTILDDLEIPFIVKKVCKDHAVLLHKGSNVEVTMPYEIMQKEGWEVIYKI